MRHLVLLLCISMVFATSEEPCVIIVGAGAAGIAAASRLLQNGINDVTILEAEDRIGGRVYSTKFGEYLIDMGGQWVHGEKGNVVYDLAWPLGLLSHSKSKEDEPNPLNMTFKFYGSNGETISHKDSQDVYWLLNNVTERWLGIEELKTGSVGEYLEKVFDAAFHNYSGISSTMREPLMNLLHLSQMSSDGGENWHKVSAQGVRDYEVCEGDLSINWRERTYGTILDILMKRYPNSEDQLPVLNKTLLSKKVTKIKYGDDGPVEVTSADGSRYTADHLIFTPSLGVLQANYESLFEPNLPEKKVNSIKNLGMGHNGKIYLYYEDLWWTTGEDIYAKSIFWAPQDRKEIEDDLQRRWMLSVHTVIQIEYKPRLLCIWLSGPNIKEMELLPEDQLKNQTLWLLNKFFGDSYNLTEPKQIIRSYWNTNQNFLGTYSYRSLDSDKYNASATDLGEPVLRSDKPVILFAGEATEPRHYSTVHGAIESGWREADRLISVYKNKQMKT